MDSINFKAIAGTVGAFAGGSILGAVLWRKHPLIGSLIGGLVANYAIGGYIRSKLQSVPVEVA